MKVNLYHNFQVIVKFYENPNSKLSIDDNKVIVIANTDGVSYFYDDNIDKETIQRIIKELKLFMFTIEEY